MGRNYSGRLSLTSQRLRRFASLLCEMARLAASRQSRHLTQKQGQPRSARSHEESGGGSERGVECSMPQLPGARQLRHGMI